MSRSPFGLVIWPQLQHPRQNMGEPCLSRLCRLTEHGNLSRVCTVQWMDNSFQQLCGGVVEGAD
ncbi:hypothetical protein E2C01_099214 [Portunus trituberculatus]|uniref:Uncharacterized protein n=1 Tax=Portunus trituberculatus TaxID=210409 RepID=A0A5B7K4X1_PORTR|nr:hypothetical protein [Portunus trituberculatus]